MRMRKKKNCDARMERCSDIWIKEPEKYKGKWAERFGNDNPIHIEIGCGKGNFIVGMAKMYPDVNFIAMPKDEWCHLGIPETSLVTKVDAGFQHLAHCYCHVNYLKGWV